MPWSCPPVSSIWAVSEVASSDANSQAARDPGQATRSPLVISVMLIVDDAAAAMSWYKRALGAEELWDLGGVAGLELAGAPFFLHEVNPHNPAEDSPSRLGVTSTRIEVFVDDPDRLIAQALAAGATPGAAIAERDTPWGKHRQGGFRDPYGHSWSVGDRSPLQRLSR